MMIIDVKTLSVGAPQSFECTQARCLPEGYGIISPCKVTVSGEMAKSEANTIMLDGKLVAELELTCGRCLEAVTYVLEADFAEEISKEEGESTIDISAQVDEHIILDIPQKVLCSDDCMGLCHTCGANLNFEKCTCEPDGDPRFSVLKNMVFDEGGERNVDLS